MKPVDATHLVNLLCERHTKDFCVPECKDGESQGRAHRRLDLWVLVRTWSPMTTIGYEVKVARHDFVQDQKLTDYLRCCHQFSLVAPKGLVALEELPAEVGLLEAIGPNGGTRLITRRKAAHRRTAELDKLLPLLVYVLMARAQEKREYEPDRADMLRTWLERKEQNRRLGSLVSQRLVEERAAMQKPIHELEGRVQHFERLAAKLRELGINPEAYDTSWRLRERLQSGQVAKALAEMKAIETAVTALRLAITEARS